MALLRLSDGRVYTAIEDINRLAGGITVGKFRVTQDTLDKVVGFSHPLSHDDAMYLISKFDPEDRKMVEAEGFTYRRVGNVVPVSGGGFSFVQRYEGGDPSDEPMTMPPEAIKAYLTPHFVHVNDWHFVFSGSIIKGVKLSEDLQGVVYAQAGEWIRLNPTILNWPIFPFGTPTAAISYFDRPMDPPFSMELHPEVSVLPQSLY